MLHDIISGMGRISNINITRTNNEQKFWYHTGERPFKWRPTVWQVPLLGGVERTSSYYSAINELQLMTILIFRLVSQTHQTFAHSSRVPRQIKPNSPTLRQTPGFIPYDEEAVTFEFVTKASPMICTKGNKVKGTHTGEVKGKSQSELMWDYYCHFNTGLL